MTKTEQAPKKEMTMAEIYQTAYTSRFNMLSPDLQKRVLKVKEASLKNESIHDRAVVDFIQAVIKGAEKYKYDLDNPEPEEKKAKPDLK